MKLPRKITTVGSLNQTSRFWKWSNFWIATKYGTNIQTFFTTISKFWSSNPFNPFNHVTYHLNTRIVKYPIFSWIQFIVNMIYKGLWLSNTVSTQYILNTTYKSMLTYSQKKNWSGYKMRCWIKEAGAQDITSYTHILNVTYIYLF